MGRIGCWLERFISAFLCVQVCILMSAHLPDFRAASGDRPFAQRQGHVLDLVINMESS